MNYSHLLCFGGHFGDHLEKKKKKKTLSGGPILGVFLLILGAQKDEKKKPVA